MNILDMNVTQTKFILVLMFSFTSSTHFVQITLEH